MQQLIELAGRHAQHRFLLADHAFFHHLHRNANRRRAGALAVAGLQHVELAVFDGELEILHVLVMLFELGGDLAQLLVGFGHLLFEIRDRLRRADAGHHVFALRVDQILAVEHLLAGGGIAREADAGAGGIAHVAEHHGLHVRGGADVVRNLFHLAVVARPWDSTRS